MTFKFNAETEVGIMFLAQAKNFFHKSIKSFISFLYLKLLQNKKKSIQRLFMYFKKKRSLQGLTLSKNFDS